MVSKYPVRVEYSLTDLGKGFEPVLFRFVFIKGTGNIFESDPDSNSIGIYLGSPREPTITTGNHFAGEVLAKKGASLYYVDSVTGEIIVKSN